MLYDRTHFLWHTCSAGRDNRMNNRSQQREWDERILAGIRAGQAFHQSGDTSAAENCFRTALEDLVQGYQSAIVAFCRNILRGHAQQANDVAQDVFLAAWRTLPGFRHQASIRTWIFAIARNRCSDALKGLIRYSETMGSDPDETTEPLDTALSPEEHHTQEDMLAYIRKGLTALDSKDREILVLTYITEMPRADIARLLGISVTSIGSRRKRALDRLREVMGHEK